MATINSIDSNIPIVVSDGGTGVASHTAYAVVTGGTTTTSPMQSIASVGTADQVLTSNGAASLPTFQAAPTMSFQTLSSDPGSPVDGQVWYNTTTDLFKGQANSSVVTFTVT